MPEFFPDYSESFSVLRHDADFMGRMKPGALLRYAQQVAVDQNTGLGLTNDYYVDHHLAYLLARQSLVFYRVPRIDERLQFTTIPERSRRGTNKRLTRVQDEAGREVALVDSLWVLVDTDTRRIIRRPDDTIEHFWNENVEGEIPFRIPKAADLQQQPSRVADYLLCDLNSHINNCCYADLACTAVPVELLEKNPICKLAINYHREVPLGETLSLACGKAENGWYSIGSKEDGLPAYEAYCEL